MYVKMKPMNNILLSSHDWLFQEVERLSSLSWSNLMVMVIRQGMTKNAEIDPNRIFKRPANSGFL